MVSATAIASTLELSGDNNTLIKALHLHLVCYVLFNIFTLQGNCSIKMEIKVLHMYKITKIK